MEQRGIGGEADENWTIRQEENHAAQMRPQRKDAEFTNFVQLRERPKGQVVILARRKKPE
ncbi:hypothetical protein PM082_021551 [Marasmius tenuissimus]|nr:hypothetical protein PM082_021551 [Marasmius tenuissimus]